MTRQADRLLEEKKWSEAKPVLESLVKLYPDSTGPDSAYRKLATAYRAAGGNKRGDAGPNAVRREG